MPSSAGLTEQLCSILTEQLDKPLSSPRLDWQLDITAQQYLDNKSILPACKYLFFNMNTFKRAA
jgi:hypothetical protein